MFDLNDVGAKIAKVRCDQRPRQQGRDVDYAQAGEGALSSNPGIDLQTSKHVGTSAPIQSDVDHLPTVGQGDGAQGRRHSVWNKLSVGVLAGFSGFLLMQLCA
ncbi:hypothetical protein [Sphingomonas paeninsulae]|uniref:hypothetical protein n=1 Tax=Sphingomonas paeninsulae TaxID=2319844 RepID=UPI0013CE4969|nr:hypothetical protein [Sphingomonas paeninsulae]